MNNPLCLLIHRNAASLRSAAETEGSPALLAAVDAYYDAAASATNFGDFELVSELIVSSLDDLRFETGAISTVFMEAPRGEDAQRAC